MKIARRLLKAFFAVSFMSMVGAAAAAQPAEEFKPVVGQAGKDVVWVPTPHALLDKMLDMARVTPRDYVIDLGSGDGRNVIAAAKRGARALGVEYNPDMVELSKRLAAKEGVADRAVFVQGDMYEADISQASVLALFLLPENLRRLTPKFLALNPGARIVANGFPIDGWEADETGHSEGDCGSWCTAYLYIVPANVAGVWRLPFGDIALEQSFQKFSGTLSADGANVPITSGRLQGDTLHFTIGEAHYVGRVSGDTMSGTVKGGGTIGSWHATRARSASR